MRRGVWSSALGSHWRREVLRTNLWVVPGVEVVAAIALFTGTLALDRAAYHGDFGLPSWVRNQFWKSTALVAVMRTLLPCSHD